MPSHCLSKVIQVSWSLSMPSCFENVTDDMFLASVFTVACSSWEEDHGHVQHIPFEACVAILGGTKESSPTCRINWRATLVSAAGTGLPGSMKTGLYYHVIRVSDVSKHLGMLRFRTLGLVLTSSMEVFYGYILFYLSIFFYFQIVTIHFGTWLQCLFLWKSSSGLCIKNFTWPSIGMMVSR